MTACFVSRSSAENSEDVVIKEPSTTVLKCKSSKDMMRERRILRNKIIDMKARLKKYRIPMYKLFNSLSAMTD